MSVDVRQDYFAGILIYKTLHGFGLYYLSPLLNFTHHHEYHQYNTRAANNNILVLSKPKCEIYKYKYVKVKLSTTASSDQHKFGSIRHRNINDITYYDSLSHIVS